MPWSLLIRGGTVIDGSGGPRQAADVALEGDRIAAVGRQLPGSADRVIEASGHIVAPGFIDAHSHSDLFYLGCPSSESKIRQGCTTEVVGMCSFSPAPIAPGRAEYVRGWAGGIGASIDLAWESFGEYLDALRSVRPSINVVHLVGHGALRLATVGPDNRPVGPDDLRAMQRLLDEAMDAGAYGYSTGLVYAPSAYAGTEELVALARGMAAREGLYFSHVRGESAMVEDSIREAIRIGEEGGVGVQIAHVKVGGRENWGKMDARAPLDRRCPGARGRRERRRVSLSCRQHQDGQPAARLGARRRPSEAARAAWRPRRAAAHRRGMRGGRRAVGHHLAGACGLRRGDDRDVWAARAGRAHPRSVRPPNGQDARRGTDGSPARTARHRRDGVLLAEPRQCREGPGAPRDDDRLRFDRPLRRRRAQARQAASRGCTGPFPECSENTRATAGSSRWRPRCAR